MTRGHATDAVRWAAERERRAYECIEDKIATTGGRLDATKRAMLRLDQAIERHPDLFDLLRPVELLIEIIGAQAAQDLETAQAAYRQTTGGDL